MRNFLLAAVAPEIKPGLGCHRLSLRPVHLISSNLLKQVTIRNLNEAAAKADDLPHAATLFRRAQNSAEIALNSGAACAYIYWAKRQFVTENQACMHLQRHQKPQSKLTRLQSAGTCSLASLRTKSHA